MTPQLVRDAIFIARSQMSTITEDEPEVKTAWESLKAIVGDRAGLTTAVADELPAVPK